MYFSFSKLLKIGCNGRMHSTVRHGTARVSYSFSFTPYFTVNLPASFYFYFQIDTAFLFAIRQPHVHLHRSSTFVDSYRVHFYHFEDHRSSGGIWCLVSRCSFHIESKKTPSSYHITAWFAAFYLKLWQDMSTLLAVNLLFFMTIFLLCLFTKTCAIDF